MTAPFSETAEVYDAWPPDALAARSADGALAACRVGHSTRDGRRTHLDLQYLIGRTGRPTVHVVEHPSPAAPGVWDHGGMGRGCGRAGARWWPRSAARPR